MPAKIKIFSKPLSPIPVGPQPNHMYLVYTNDAGEARILRGGPEGSNMKGALIGDIVAQDDIYDSDHSIDYPKLGEPRSSDILFEGTDAEMYARTFLNIDPVVLGLNDDGVKLNSMIYKLLDTTKSYLNEVKYV